MPSDIIIRGAREHNLRNVDLRLPRNTLICMTGVSGSGKSSLAFDTLYAEGQRRYVESLSSYARQFLGQMPKPEVDSVSGLAPSISIQQKTAGRNPRSTVGTITEIYDYLRVLFARIGKAHCPKCGRPITAQTAEQIIDGIAVLPAGTRYAILAPVIQQQKGEYRDLFEDLLKRGYLRARVDGRVVELTENLQLDRHMRHTIEVVVDRLVAGKTPRARLADSVEQALRLSGGTLVVSSGEGRESRVESREPDGEVERRTSNIEHSTLKARTGKSVSSSRPSTLDTRHSLDRLYSAHYACTHCQIGFEPPSPQLFSFNSPQGMCLDCNGLGMRHDFVVERLVPNEKLSIAKGAIELLGPLKSVGRWRRHILEGVAAAIEHDLDMMPGTLLKSPWRELPDEARRRLLYGTGDRHITFAWRFSGGVYKHGGSWSGYVAELLESYRKARNPMRRRQLEKCMDFSGCSTCAGSRLGPQARGVTITSRSGGRPASRSDGNGSETASAA
ncbi:MAG TPA: excinuclease ABC subunit A, partial [Planctomycetaceae bacterium]|nr:excinuclease ABC subunit A [Planctomycetaceae bacterium]